MFWSLVAWFAWVLFWVGMLLVYSAYHNITRSPRLFGNLLLVKFLDLIFFFWGLLWACCLSTSEHEYAWFCLHACDTIIHIMLEFWANGKFQITLKVMHMWHFEVCNREMIGLSWWSLLIYLSTYACLCACDLWILFFIFLCGVHEV